MGNWKIDVKAKGEPPPPGERGMALLAVLLLVTFIGVLAVAAVEKLRLSTALSVNSRALAQAQAYAQGVEALTLMQIEDLIAANPERASLPGGSQTRRAALPGGGIAEARVRDGANCFNINSVADGNLRTGLTLRPIGIAQFIALMQALGVSELQADQVAAAAADWVDSDRVPAANGAEDEAYAGLEQPYRTSNTLFSHISELKAVSGVTPDLYARMSPWLCALPVTDLSPININTLRPEQAPLLAMLAPDLIEVERARQVLSRRPPPGWGSLNEFWRTPELLTLMLPLNVQLQPQLRSRWFELFIAVQMDGSEFLETALIDARTAPARIVYSQRD